jgi:hypothetical protein
MTYEPYLSAVREKPDAGKIIATTLDYPMVMDTFGCTPRCIAENEPAVRALVKSYFDALGMIHSDQKRSYEIMGVVPENSIRQDSRCEGESDHHPMRCLRSSICSEHLSPICSSRGAGLKLRTSFCVISSTLS